jgi:hypothetical protein
MLGMEKNNLVFLTLNHIAYENYKNSVMSCIGYTDIN